MPKVSHIPFNYNFDLEKFYHAFDEKCRGHSLDQIQERLACSFAVVNGIVRRTKIPTYSFVQKFARLYGYDLVEFAMFTPHEILNLIVTVIYSNRNRVPKPRELPWYYQAIFRYWSKTSIYQQAVKAIFREKPISSLYRRYSDEDYINQIKMTATLMGRTPRFTDVSHGPAIVKRFGSWNEAIRRSGLKPNTVFIRPKRRKQIVNGVSSNVDPIVGEVE